jgi:peptidoglycan/LPS O-acetylase OafA/YrhL
MTQTTTEPVRAVDPADSMPARAATAERTARRTHVYEADVVRVLTFACVIGVHTISHTEPASSVPANGFEMLLHFTREAFFALTGFVLIHQSLSRATPLSARTFWRRRLVAVCVPYVAWSLVYTGIQATAGVGSFGSELHHLADNLAFGTAWYHLYFLLVSMQIYLLFPLIEALVRRTARHHGVLLAVSAAVQLTILSYQMYFPVKHGWLAQVGGHQDALIVSYQFYVLLGAVGAFHLADLRTFAHTYRRPLIAFVVASAIGAEVWYLLAVDAGTAADQAAAVLQPAMLVWSVAAVIGLFLVGMRYAEHRTAGSRIDRALNTASDRSFGVFLVHPLVLWLLLQGQVRWLPGLRGAPLTILAYLLVVVGSLIATEIFRRSPLSLPLTGRRVLRPSVQPGNESVRPGNRTPGNEATECTASTAAYRKEPDHALHESDAPVPGNEAPHRGNDDGDRHRTADALLL